MKTLRTTTALLAALTVAGSSRSIAQADAKSTITIYPFGTAPSVIATSREIAPAAANRTSEGLLAVGKLFTKNQSMDAAIQAQIDAAGGLSQFNAVKPIERDKGLQTKYLLVGYVEGAEAKPTQLEDKRTKKTSTVYNATVDVTLQVVDVETGALVDSKKVTISNNVDTGERSCDGLNFLKKRACEELNKRNSDLQRGVVGGQDADTPLKAYKAATVKLTSQTTEWVNGLIATGKIK